MPNYLQNLADTSGISAASFPELKIQKNDLLSIQVYSMSTRPEVSDAMFNMPSLIGANGTQTGGILVDANGDIDYPRLGVFHVEGLTKQELATQIRKRLIEPVELLKDPSVVIRLLNYKVTVMGQVGREGPVSYPGEHLTILEAIGLAGGINDFGLKDSVKVIRQVNGMRQVGFIDLSSKELFNSPYYNLVQNDIVMVDPTKMKAKLRDQQIVVQRLTLALSLITTASILYNIFK